jgi:glycosyltransferase involved in cell wall biosynthesis
MSNEIYIIFNNRFPGEKAASLFAAKSCESFADAGVNVTLLVPRRVGRGNTDPYTYYRTKKNFKIVYLPTLDLLNLRFLQGITFQIGLITFSLFCFLYLFFKANKNDVIYSNESLPILLCSFYFPRTLYEVHDFPEHKIPFYRLLFHRVRHILVTNTWKIKQLEQTFAISRDKIFCERNAVDVKEFDIALTKEEARKKLHLPEKGKIVVYTGHLYKWKGVDTLAEAAKILPADTLVVFVGGTEADIKRFRGAYGDVANIRILGYRDHSEIPLWQKAADVLVLPNTAKENISKYYTSPMKLFEYAASSRPIVASRIPSITELVDKRTAFLVEPDNAEALADGIRYVCENETSSLVNMAYAWVGEYTWAKRAERILRFIGILI